MSFSARLRERREALGLRQKDLAQKLSVAPSAVANYESGYSSPKTDILMKIFDILNCDANYLFQDDVIPLAFSYSEEKLINQYRTLDEHGKSVVEQILALECERMSRMRDIDRPCAPARVIQLDKYLVPSSAGTGVVSIDCDKEVITVVDNMYTRQAAFAVPIRGNSMEPRFRDGDILLISEDLPELGEIGIFVMTDRLYLKQLHHFKILGFGLFNIQHNDIISAGTGILHPILTAADNIHQIFLIRHDLFQHICRPG